MSQGGLFADRVRGLERQRRTNIIQKGAWFNSSRCRLKEVEGVFNVHE